MKRITAFIAAALLVCACAGSLPEFSITGPVQTVQVLTDGTTPEFGHIHYYNREGQVDSTRWFNPDSSFRYISINRYDSRGRLAESFEIDADGDTECRYEYDYDGRFIAECRMYGMNNQEVHRWTHTNDRRNIVRTDYFSEGEFVYTSNKVYSTPSHCSEVVTGPDGEELGRSQTDFFAKDLPSRLAADGIDVSVEYDSCGRPVHSVGAVLDSECHLGWSPTLEDNPERFYTYEVDSYGNWTVRHEKNHPEGPDVSVIRRVIEYYK